MIKQSGLAVILAAGFGLLTACTNDQGINSASGALVGAAAGQAVGEGRGRAAATLAGAAIGAQVGANQPTNRLCTYRDSRTGQTFQDVCR